MEQATEGAIENPPVYEAGENYVQSKEAEILIALAKIIDWAQIQEYEGALSRVSQETKAA